MEINLNQDEAQQIMTTKSGAYDLSYQPTQEIRFAVVMFGGVSLAIYMNGITQELFRMVRATAPASAHDDKSASQKPLLGDQPPKSTSKVYRKLGQMLAHGEPWRTPSEIDPAKDPILTRFVVDILAGTSAGGINSVFLSKALANNQEVDFLNSLWNEQGNIDLLLNDKKSYDGSIESPSPKTSLLNSQRMFHQLFSAFQGMDKGIDESNEPYQRSDGYRSPLVDELDLYVTATDLEGIWAPMETSDRIIDERIHKLEFNFQYRPGRAYGSNDFLHEYNGMLAFASRCTSSFPVAFEPMKLTDVKMVPELRNADLTKNPWRKFFHRYRSAGESNPSYTERQLADGGYLQNKPLRYALDAIRYRDAWGPVNRKLLFLDPFPEYREDQAAGTKQIDFITNLLKASTELPRYQSIRQDLEAINQRNRQIYRVQVLRKRLRDSSQTPNWKVRSSEEFEKTGLDTLVSERGANWASYHHLRVFSVTDDLALLVTRLTGFAEDTDEFRAIRYLVRAWRESRYESNPPKDGGKHAETKYWKDFDICFRMRRLDRLRMEIDLLLEEKRKGIRNSENPHSRHTDNTIEQLKAIRQGARTALRGLEDAHNELWATEGAGISSERRTQLQKKSAKLGFTKTDFNHILAPVEEDACYKRAQEVLSRTGDENIQDLAESLQEMLGAEFNKAARSVRKVLGYRSDTNSTPLKTELRILYDLFDYYDSLLFPVLSAMEVGEADQVEVYRVGPADATHTRTLLDPDGKQKLAGTALMNFGAFLRREWRDNDVMWGRLDGSERIICALLPGDDLKTRNAREELTEEAHRIILDEIFPQVQEDFMPLLARYLRSSEDSKTKKEAQSFDEVLEQIRQEVQNKPSGLASLLLQNAINSEQRIDLFRKAYKAPLGPPIQQSVTWVRRAVRIFADMLTGLDDGSGQMSRIGNRLSKAAAIIGTLVELSLPKTKLGRCWNWIVGMAASASAMILAAGYLFLPEVKPAGWIWLGFTAAFIIVTLAFRRLFSGKWI